MSPPPSRPTSRDFRVNPRFLVSFIDSKTARGDQFKLRPSLRLDYYWSRKLSLEFEGGAEWLYERVGDQTDTTRDYFFVLGYRMDF